MRTRFQVVVVLLVALTTALLPACTKSKSGDDAQPPKRRPTATATMKADVSPTKATTVELASGIRIEIPEGAVSGTGTLVVKPIDPTKVAAPPDGMIRVAQPVDVTLAGATLTGKAKIVLPIEPEEGATTVQGVLDPATRTWSAELGRYDPKRKLLVTEVTHFSVRDWFRIDLRWAKDFAKKLLLGKFGEQLDNVDHVTCPNQDWPATEGWKVNSTSEPRITWCLDRTGDSRTLRMRDGARYAVSVRGPDGLGYTRPTLPWSIGAPFLKFEEALNSGFSDQTFTIIRRGEDLTVDLAEVGGTAKFQIEPNMTAYLADLFEIEVELVAELIGRITPAFVPKSVEALSDTQTLLDSDAAGRCLADAFDGDDLSPDAQRSVDPVSIAGVTADCAVTAIKAAAGIPGFILGTFISVVTIPGDLLGTFTAGMSAVTNPLDYTITVTAPPSLSVLDRQTRPDNCEVRRLSQYSTAEEMGLDDDDLGWYLPWDEFPGSTIGRSSTTSDLTVLLRGPSGKLQRADIDRLASYIRDTNFEDADPFILCTNADGVYWVEQAPPPNLPDNSDQVTLDGVGTLRIGATYEEAEMDTGLPMGRHYPMFGEDESCVDGSFGRGKADGVTVLGSDGRIRRIQISAPSQIRTRSGIGVGSSEADLQAAYPGRVTIAPHPYVVGWNWVTYRPADANDRMMIFETDGDSVVLYRVGDDAFTPHIDSCSGN